MSRGNVIRFLLPKFKQHFTKLKTMLDHGEDLFVLKCESFEEGQDMEWMQDLLNFLEFLKSSECTKLHHWNKSEKA